MEKVLNPYEKEYMKMAMLKHEETFKEQVCELHRLYRIQMMLMKNIQSNNGLNNGWDIQERWNSKNGDFIKQIRKLDLEQPAEEYIGEENGNGEIQIEDECQIELTLGPTNYSRRRKKADHQTPLNSDSGPSFSSSNSTGSSHMKKTNCGTHHQNADRSTRKESMVHDWGFVHNHHPGFHQSDERRSDSFLVEEQLRQQERLKQPPWILQALSMNMT